MTKAKVWKMNDKWAGISAKGERVIKNTKSAARKAVGLDKEKKSKSPKTKNKKKVKKMAKKKTKRRYKMTIPIAPVIGLGVGMIEPIAALFKGNVLGALDRAAENYIGWNRGHNRFELKGLQKGLLPVVIGLLVHKFIGGYLGLNRMLGRAKVPLLRL